MLTGPIQPLPRTLPVDRSTEEYALWEHDPKPNAVDLPWRPAASFDARDVRDLLASARTVVVAGSRASLYEHLFSSLKPGMRVYAYGSRAMEAERGLAQAVAKAADRVNVRLGHELPADWLVVDEGRAGWLFVGPPGEERRWAIPLDQEIARSLFEAFRVLFWYHATREGLPDAAKSFAFRPPLPAPYADPGKEVRLRSGRLLLDRPLQDLVPDAEFRIVPDGSVPGRCATALLPPDAKAFDRPRQLSEQRCRVVWTETGLPRTTISRQRLVMDLVHAPIGIQLEWGAGIAVDIFHHITKACEKPEWAFHEKRRLKDVTGTVLLEGTAGTAPVKADERIDVGDLRSPLTGFEAAEPRNLPSPPPLAKQVVYAWRTVPVVVPAGGHKAELVRQWIRLDEWASRGVEVLCQRLAGMEGEEGTFLDRLRGLLRGQDAVKREQLRIRDALAEIGEQPPSQRSDAAEAVSRLIAEAGKLRGLLAQAHGVRQKAEDDADEAEQRKTWQSRVARAAKDLAEKREDLSRLEGRESDSNQAIQDAESALDDAVVAARAARRARLKATQEADELALDQARRILKELQIKHPGNVPEEERKLLAQKVQRLEPALVAVKKDLAGVERWTPPPGELVQENAQLKQAREEKEVVRKVKIEAQGAIGALERVATETFTYRPGARVVAPKLPDLGTAPAVPNEALPELGELFEHQGQRFLAVRTWEQWARAGRAATRLGAELVAFPDSIK